MNVPIFESYGGDCRAETYELLAPDAETLSTDFQSGYVRNDEDGVLVWALTGEEAIHTIKASYEYRIRVSGIDDSDDVIFEDSVFTFKTICGERSFEPPTIEERITYEIDDGRPSLKLPIFVPLFPDCAITNYGLYSDSETPSEPFD